MNHNFIANPNENDKCIECGYPENKHGDNASCDCCEKTGNLQPYLLGNSQALLTRECMEREKAFLTIQVEISEKLREIEISPLGVPADGENRVLQMNALTNPYNKLIGEARKIDEQLHLSSDIFTAKTVSIEDIRQAIWNNEKIPSDKKFFEFVSECKRRISHFQNVIFSLDKAKIEAYSEQKAWHVAMNQYANKLRAEEREQLKIQDIHYDVKMPKPITPAKIKTFEKKASQKDIRIAVNALNTELGIPNAFSEMTVNFLMVSKNWTLEQTINKLRQDRKENKSEGN